MIVQKRQFEFRPFSSVLSEQKSDAEIGTRRKENSLKFRRFEGVSWQTRFRSDLILRELFSNAIFYNYFRHSL